MGGDEDALAVPDRGSNALLLDNVAVKLSTESSHSWLWADGGGFECISTDGDDSFTYDADDGAGIDYRKKYCKSSVTISLD